MRQTIYYPALNTVARYKDGIVQTVAHNTRPHTETGAVLISLAEKVYVELPNNLKNSRVWHTK